MLKLEAPSLDRIQPIAVQILHTDAFTIEREQSGGSTYVYRIRTDSGQTRYLRILPEPACCLAPEVKVHGILQNNGVPVPEVIYYAPHQRIEGMSFMLVDEIPGTNAISVSSKSDYASIIREAGRKLARVNRIRVKGWHDLRRDYDAPEAPLQGETAKLSDYLFASLDDHLACLSMNGFPHQELATVRKMLFAGAALFERHSPCLAHGDFDDTHIFAKEGSFTGIIDFGDIQGSSPLFDLGHYKLHDGQHRPGQPGFRFLVEGYREARMLSNEDYTEIDLWALWIGVRRLGRRGRHPWGPYQHFLQQRINLQLALLRDRLRFG